MKLLHEIPKAFRIGVLTMFLLCMLQLVCSSFTTINENAWFLNNKEEHLFGLILLGSSLFLVALLVFYKWLYMVKDKTVCILLFVLAGIGMVLQLVIVFSFDVMPTTDSYMCLDVAGMLTEGEVTNLTHPDSDYFSIYGNNDFYTLFLALICKICNVFGMGKHIIRVLTIINMLFIDLGIFFGCKLVQKLFGMRIQALFLGLSVVCPVTYFSIIWVYTCTFSLAWMTGTLWLGFNAYDYGKSKRGIVYAGILGASTVVGLYLRPTTVIPVVALVIGGILRAFCGALPKKIWKSIGCYIGTLVVTCCLFSGILQGFRTNENTTFPYTHWLMMATHGDGVVTASDIQYTKSFEKYEDKKKANIDRIKEQLLQNGVSGTLHLFSKKLDTTWSTGTDDFYLRMLQDRKNAPVYSYVVGNRNDLISLYCQIYRATIWLLVLFCCLFLLHERKVSEMFLVLLSLFGGFLFYLIWEAKAAYSIPFTYISLICALNGLSGLNIRLSQTLDKLNKGKCKSVVDKVAVGVLIISILIMTERFHIYTEGTMPTYRYSVNCVDEYSEIQQISNVSQKGRVIEQEFYAVNPFNKIGINAWKIEGNARYQVELVNAQNEVLETTFVESDHISDNMIYIEMSKMYCESVHPYRIRISAKAKGEADSVGFGYRVARVMDNYKGNLTIDADNCSYDLFLRVYEETSQPYMSSKKYIFVCLLGIMLEIILYIGLRKYLLANTECI